MIQTVNNQFNATIFQVKHFLESKKAQTVQAFDQMLVRFDAWFLVLLAVIMTLAVTIGTGLAIWCLVYQGKNFTGNWKWDQTGVSISVECK